MENSQSTAEHINAQLDRTELNSDSLVREVAWFAQVVNHRLRDYFPEHKTNAHDKKTSITSEPSNNSDNPNESSFSIAPPPNLADDHSVYAEFVKYYKLSSEERLLLMLTIIPHIQPHLLDVFFSTNKALGRGFTEFGGVKGNRHNGFIPTVETALFLLAGNDLARRFHLHKLFDSDHIFTRYQIILVEQGADNEPFYSSPIHLTEEYVDFFTTGYVRKPQFSMEFPAKQLTTGMEWRDLVVDEFTATQLDELRIWLQHGRTLYENWGMSSKLKPGYKALFHGPSGTGKTLTAALLGKLYNIDVYRVDLSMVISKYIGDTEKNLEKVFKKAENKNWILFFDEADSLFGKRTSISDSHDKYANQEISYLLQRLEDYSGLVILASNMRNNVDEAFTRRLQAIIHFKNPQGNERLQIWINAFSKQCTPPSHEQLQRIAQQYELSGGTIMNVVQYASLLALNRNDTSITVDDLLQGIKKEFRKEGKTL
jgi:hypothetical protein